MRVSTIIFNGHTFNSEEELKETLGLEAYCDYTFEKSRTEYYESLKPEKYDDDDERLHEQFILREHLTSTWFFYTKTKKQCAEEIGISLTTFRKIEKGDDIVSPLVWEKLTRYFYSDYYIKNYL